VRSAIGRAKRRGSLGTWRRRFTLLGLTLIAVATSYFFTIGRAPNFQHLVASVVGLLGLAGLFVDWAISRNIQRSGGVQAIRSGGVLSTGPVATAGRLWAQGEGFRIFGLDDDARKNYQEAAQLFKEAGEKEGYADARLSLGQLEASAGNADGARKIFTDTIEVYQSDSKPRGQGQGYIELGLVDLMQRNHDAAKQSFHEAARLFHGENDRMGEGNALLNYAECCTKLTQTDEASGAYDQARFCSPNPATGPARRTRSIAARKLTGKADKPARPRIVSKER
jgi:hypothetical protein